MNAHRLDFDTVARAAVDRWPAILEGLGIDAVHLQRRHGPCPGCGGRDRFRFDDRDGRGSFICGNGGGPVIAGDGFELLRHVHGWSRPEALQQVAQWLGMASRTEAPPRRHLAVVSRDYDAEQHQRQQQAAERAQRLWGRAHGAASDHPYLLAKGVLPHGLRLLDGNLLVPLFADGVLVNLQTITPDGAKRFLSGGRVKGCHSLIGQITPDQPLLICEGWATGATLHEQTGFPVAAAMNAGNLLAAGRALKAHHPGVRLIVCGDDDRRTFGNPGRAAAISAAATLGCEVAFPEWPAGAPDALTDFNDLATWGMANG